MDQDFQELIRQVVAGNQQAAGQLVQEFEPEIRRIVRFRLKNSQLRRIFDSTDICQSVFGQFFCLASLGRFELEKRGDLINLLAKMASNRVIDRHRTEQSQQRLQQQRFESRAFDSAGDAIDVHELPDSEVEWIELVDIVRERLSNDERQISQLRSAGKSWLEVAEQMGRSPQALRKQLERACREVFAELGVKLDE